MEFQQLSIDSEGTSLLNETDIVGEILQEENADMPLAKYVRECWENENGNPFYFMDWIKMAGG